MYKRDKKNRDRDDSENNTAEAEKLYNKLLENNIPSIIDDREGMSLGSKINDTYVWGTPNMIILGSKFDKENYEIENTLTNEKEKYTIETLIERLKNDEK